MKEIKKIVREEIERMIVNENISSLNNYAANLKMLVDRMNQSINAASLDKYLNEFFNNFNIYISQVIHAINRCVKANSLNEILGFGLRDFGINIPREMGGEFFNDSINGYKSIKNALSGGKNNSKNKTFKPSNTYSVQSIKLSECLRRLPIWEREYTNKNRKYNIDSITRGGIKPIFQELNSLNSTYANLSRTV